MFINVTDLLELISRNILKTSDIKYKKLYNWINIVIVNVLVYFIRWKTMKQMSKFQGKIGKSKYFCRKFSVLQLWELVQPIGKFILSFSFLLCRTISNISNNTTNII